MLIEFPIEFLVHGTPVSFQSGHALSKTLWKTRVRNASNSALPSPHFASQDRIAITLFYLPEEEMEGDLDNIVKLILDALNQHIYIDDRQIERIVVQKFEPGNVFGFTNPTDILLDALTGSTPVLYVRISTDPFEDLQ